MNTTLFLAVILVVLHAAVHTDGFSRVSTLALSRRSGARIGRVALQCASPSSPRNDAERFATSRSQFLSRILIKSGISLVVGSGLFAPSVVLASDEPSRRSSLEGCSRAPAKGFSNCAATASIKQVDNYAPPWTFQVSGDEAMARLKGVVETDSTLEAIEEEESSGYHYLKVKATRNVVVVDEIEFLVNDADQVVTFRSSETGEPSISDFGANKSRLDSIRKRCGVFGVMGEGLMTADSYQGDNGSGPLGQLKSFYGLQSGRGFEDVFED